MELIVSDFLSSTCVVNPQPNISKIHAMCRALVHIGCSVVNSGVNRIAISSGSVAEFYIDPMLSCINDVDIMFHSNNMLAIPAGHPCPPSIPTEFHREVQVCELENTKYPCYVLLRHTYSLTTRASGTFRAVVDKRESTGTEYLYRSPREGLHGPAVLHDDQFALINRFRVGDSKSSSCSVDCVHCVRCLVWPPQASEWLTRLREHGWPDSATIDCVVNNGCDVVKVAHPECRHDGCMSIYQWRLSFSRAETVLLNSWSPKQQLVYHVLRVVATIIQSNYQDTIIRRYYLKTLMLWACERNSENWWNDRCVVSICTQLLHELTDWLRSGKLPMYFVTECNLLDKVRHFSSEQLELFICDLSKLTNETLSMHVFARYVRQCAQLCELDSIDSRYFDGVSTISHVNIIESARIVLSIIIDERLRNLNLTCSNNFDQAVYCLEQIIFIVEPTAKSCHYVIEQLQAIDYRLIDFFCSSVFLNILKKLERGDSAVDVGDLVVTVVRLQGQYTAGTNAPIVNKCLTVKDCTPSAGTNTGLKFGKIASPHLKQPASKVPLANWHTIALLVVLIYIIHPELCADKTINFESNSLHRLLLHSAVECLSVFRQIMSRDFSSVSAIVTSDYEAMYAYKCGLYEQCFRLCYQNFKSLLDVPLWRQSIVTHFPELYFFHQLLDNDCLSLTCAARFCGAFDTSPRADKEPMTQLTLSCYLLLQSKIKLKHSPSTFVDILRYVKRVHDSHEARNIGNRSMLIFIYHKVISYMKSGLSK